VTTDLTKTRADSCLDPPSNENFDKLSIVLPRRAAASRIAHVNETLLSTTANGRRPLRIALKVRGTISFIDSADVIAIEVKGNHLSLLHTSGVYVLHESIKMAEHKLNLHGFVRIHRSVLVNAAFVEELWPCSAGQYVLRVKGGKQYKITRTYRMNMQYLAGVWIGTDGFLAK
jgi:DNA-binding LytR/AlgR family response regulator